MIRFEKVSREQFEKDWLSRFSSKSAEKAYEAPLPMRNSAKSAGYDFYSPASFVIMPGQCVVIPTGVRAIMDSCLHMQLHIRSGMSLKGLRMVDTVGIIDADYAGADNEGHIMIGLQNDGKEMYRVEYGDRIGQGIFLMYYTTDDDYTEARRKGGFGSSGR